MMPYCILHNSVPLNGEYLSAEKKVSGDDHLLKTFVTQFVKEA